VLHYNGPGSGISHYVDIATQPVWCEGIVEMIDLDLDVLVLDDGTVPIDDEDEFEEHQVSFGYPRGMIERARSETSRVADLIDRGEEPFFDVAVSWLEQVPSIPARGPSS